jgi:hypothetical protein
MFIFLKNQALWGKLDSFDIAWNFATRMTAMDFMQAEQHG